MKKYLIIFVMLVLFTVFLVVSKKLERHPFGNEVISDSVAVRATPSPEPTFNSNEDYYQYFLKSKGLAITQPKFINLIGEGKQAVFIAVGEGCGSCHYNEVYIFNGREEIFTFYGEDTKFTPIVGKGFILSQPLLREGQSYSERSEFDTATYVWDGIKFLRTKVSPNWVDTPQIPG